MIKINAEAGGTCYSCMSKENLMSFNVGNMGVTVCNTCRKGLAELLSDDNLNPINQIDTQKRNVTIVKVNEKGIVTYLTSSHKLGELTYSFIENINFAHVYKSEFEAWEVWNNISNTHAVKKEAGVMTRVI